MVESRMRNLTRACVVAGAALSLISCNSIREAAGITKEAPDEFAVVTKAPLIIPPDYNLHPPKPGAPPLNQVSPTAAAQQALYSDDPSAIASSITGNYSQAEKLLLANSGGAVADPSIRRTIAADNTQAEDIDPSLTDKLLFGGGTDNSADKPLDASAEKARLAAAKTGAQPASDETSSDKTKESATINQPNGNNNPSDAKDDSDSSSWWPF